MNLRETRHITITTGRGGFLVPTHSHVQENGKVLKVKFTFDKSFNIPDFDSVDADNEDGYIRMVTSKGIEFNSGGLFDQLFVWYDQILNN